MSLLTALTTNGARTDPRSRDSALRGRTYAIPFDQVWNAALHLAGGGLEGWRVDSADDNAGVIHAVTPKRLFGGTADVRVRVGLDANAQTRVDVEARTRDARTDWGANRRRIRSLVSALDAKLGATPAQILDATHELSVSR